MLVLVNLISCVLSLISFKRSTSWMAVHDSNRPINYFEKARSFGIPDRHVEAFVQVMNIASFPFHPDTLDDYVI